MGEGRGGDDTAQWVDAVRGPCRAQRAIWQRVPSLALEAAEPGDDVLELAIGAGLWPVGPVDHIYSAYVDCATGEIVDAEDPQVPASDATLAALRPFGKYLSAVAVVTALRERIIDRGGVDENAAWRAEVRQATGLVPHRPYTRAPGLGLE